MALSSVRSCDGESARHSSIIASAQNRPGNLLTAPARYALSLPYLLQHHLRHDRVDPIGGHGPGGGYVDGIAGIVPSEGLRHLAPA